MVAAERRCSPYESDDYPYSQSVEPRIVASMGGVIYGPYTGTWFDSTSQTDIEHIVARSEAHDSGLCAVDAATKRRFASDLLNLTLASPAVNRSQKSGKDATEWIPDLNQCWFANRVVEVRQQYSLTVDQRERAALGGAAGTARNTTFDVYLNSRAYWRNIPAAVWNYKLGGYQVLKKWLSYRECKVLGRSLLPEEVLHFTDTARRIAAILRVARNSRE